jgi:hypothetical protein
VLGGLRGICCSSEGEGGGNLLGAVLSVLSVWLCGIHTGRFGGLCAGYITLFDYFQVGKFDRGSFRARGIWTSPLSSWNLLIQLDLKFYTVALRPFALLRVPMLCWDSILYKQREVVVVCFLNWGETVSSSLREGRLSNT